jgi:glycosyltransferase involved in cell wall biosynthesis
MSTTPISAKPLKPLISMLLPDLRGGGAERVSVNLANAFVQQGHSVDIVLLSATGEFLSELYPKVNVVDLKVSRMRGAIFSLVRYLRSIQPAALLACMWPLTVLAILARVLSRVPTRVVVAEHTTWSRSELLSRFTIGWQVRTSMYHFFPKADAIVAVSGGAADDLARFSRVDRSKISVIYNPVVENGARRLACPPEEPQSWCAGSHRRILAVGTLKAIKDYATLLNAFAVLCRRVDARLLILGEGECRDALETQARALGIADSVFMPGFVANPAPYYEHADLHVLSSTGEGLPTVLIESLAAGTPVVSTDCPSGPREILAAGEFGRLVPVGDPESMANAMQASLAAEHDRAALMERAQDFSVDKAASRYLELLLPNLAARGAA